MIHCAGMACDLDKPPPSTASPVRVKVELAEQPPSLYPLTTEAAGFVTRAAPRWPL